MNWIINDVVQLIVQALEIDINQTYFEQKYITLIESAYSSDKASFEVIDAYLAGKPTRTKKQKKVNKSNLFWSSQFIWNFSKEVIDSEPFILTLSRYFSQDFTSNFSLITHWKKKSHHQRLARAYVVLK